VLDPSSAAESEEVSWLRKDPYPWDIENNNYPINLVLRSDLASSSYDKTVHLKVTTNSGISSLIDIRLVLLNCHPQVTLSQQNVPDINLEVGIPLNHTISGFSSDPACPLMGYHVHIM
jgi:hypothetical protein